MLRTWVYILVLLCAAPAQAAFISQISVDLHNVYDGSGEAVCEPCGPSFIAFDQAGNYYVDWYGGAGLAHDAYFEALSGGIDIFDTNSDPRDFDTWFATKPTGLVVYSDEGGGPAAFVSDWLVEVYDAGHILGHYTDHIDFAVGGDGLWFTSFNFRDFGIDGLSAAFSVPAKVPEPSTLLLGLSAVLAWFAFRSQAVRKAA